MSARRHNPWRALLVAPDAPAGHAPIDRLALIVEIMEALKDGRVPSPEACHFGASALSAWLQDAQGRELVRDFFQIAPRPGSHATPASLYRELKGRK